MNNTIDFDFIKKRVSHLIKESGFLIADKPETSITAKEGHANYVTDMDIKVQSEGILGAVYNPFLNELFFGIRDKGACLNGNPIKVSSKPFNQAIVALGTAPYYSGLADKTFDIAKKLFKECADFRRSGSAALDICYIACGSRHIQTISGYCSSFFYFIVI